MLNPSLIESYLEQLTPEQMHSAVDRFLPANASDAEKISAIEALLRGPSAEMIRPQLERWVVRRIVPVDSLVPEAYAQWRPPVRDSMMFVVSRLAPERLAPKVLEQLQLPLDTPPEVRLLRLISKVPGLQKLGQVLARNRHLRPSMRAALSELENGIDDVKAEEICAIIRQQLGPQIEKYAVEIEAAKLSEASVSAVVRFTWRNPRSGVRERGVFKVLKPYVPTCFAEDMQILQGLADWFGSRHHQYGFAPNVIPDTFSKVRELLQHEVDFVGEQRTLLRVPDLYRNASGVRVPGLIKPLCTPTITAITEEYGAKVTTAAAHITKWRRGLIANQLVEALVAAPLFATERESLFHADPHAGNLLYNTETGELVVLDWALTERLTREQRRHLSMLVFMVGLRDRVGAANAILALRQRGVRHAAHEASGVRRCVGEFLDELPLVHVPSPVDAMRLLEQVALTGVRFPAALIMFSKVLFTLDGILDDIGGFGASIGVAVGQHLLRRGLIRRAGFGTPLTVTDWLSLQCSALLFGSRLWVRGEQEVVNRLLPPRPEPPPVQA